jgi:single-strand DNA-binding protein
MPSLNRITLIGRLGGNPDLRNTPSGRQVATFRMATNESYTDSATREKKSLVEWHDVECWGALAKTVADYLAKGRLVYVEGSLRTDRWEKDGQKHSRTKVVASRVQFLDRAGQSDAADGETIREAQPA